jgi:hypothetical protein
MTVLPTALRNLLLYPVGHLRVLFPGLRILEHLVSFLLHAHSQTHRPGCHPDLWIRVVQLNVSSLKGWLEHVRLYERLRGRNFETLQLASTEGTSEELTTEGKVPWFDLSAGKYRLGARSKGGGGRSVIVVIETESAAFIGWDSMFGLSSGLVYGDQHNLWRDIIVSLRFRSQWPLSDFR